MCVLREEWIFHSNVVQVESITMSAGISSSCVLGCGVDRFIGYGEA